MIISRAFSNIASSNGPLSGLRILDLSRVLAGPYATMMLGDMGAEVIKIEHPLTGDDTRSWGPPFTEKGRESSYFLSINRNKRSVAVDMKKAKGQEIIRQLADKCDVVIENFAPGDALKLGLDRDKFRKMNEKLIWCSITGYGPNGPLSKRLGYAVLVEAHAGLMNSTGPRDGGPAKVGVALTDVVTGLHASTAILAAIYHRQSTGKGTVIDCSLLESQVSAMTNLASNWLIGKQDTKRMGTEHASIVPYGCVHTQDGMLAIGANNDKQFLGLCTVLNVAHLATDERFCTNAKRVQHRVALIAELESVLTTKSSQHWIEVFDCAEDQHKFAFAPVNNMQQVFEDPQVLHRGMVAEVEHRTAGRIRLPGMPIKFPELQDVSQQSQIRLPPPVLGEHTKEVLQELLLLQPKALDTLIDEKVVYQFTSS